MNRRLPNRRIRLLLVLFTLAFAGLFGRAVWLQGVHARGLDRIARGQHHATVALPAPRGAMVDRNGVQLAIGRRATTIYANPKHIANPQAAAIAAGKALRLDPDKLYGPLADQSRGFVYVARKADAKRADALRRRASRVSGSTRRSGACIRRDQSAPMSSGTQVSTTKACPASSWLWTGRLPRRPGRETVATRSAARSTSCTRRRPSRAATSA